MQDSVLETIGRKHTTVQTIEAFRMAREAGFDNINMDLIAGLPGDTPEGFHDTLEQNLALNPDSITVHALTLKRAANLFAEGESQVHNPVEQMVQEIMDERQSIFGAGCGASTKLVEPCGKITRIHNYKFPYEYIRQFDQLMEKKQQVREICAQIREQEEA